MLKVTTINLNGIRSAYKKGLFDWIKQENPDIICVQELKAQEPELQHPSLHLAGYHSYFHFAEKKGYSGVGIYSRYPARKVVRGLGFDLADQEGRHIAIDLGNLWISSVYLPSGTSGPHRQAHKFTFLDHYINHLQKVLECQVPHIICGDFNIAHKTIDLKNWRPNQKNSGFLPEERAWLDQVFDKLKFFDAFRLINQEADQYTWWSHRGRAREKNVGWRIDYHIVTPMLSSKVKGAAIYKDQFFSDHAPLTINYDFSLTG